MFLRFSNSICLALLVVVATAGGADLVLLTFVTVLLAMPVAIYVGLGLVFMQLELVHDDDASAWETITRAASTRSTGP